MISGVIILRESKPVKLFQMLGERKKTDTTPLRCDDICYQRHDTIPGVYDIHGFGACKVRIVVTKELPDDYWYLRSVSPHPRKEDIQACLNHGSKAGSDKEREDYINWLKNAVTNNSERMDDIVEENRVERDNWEDFLFKMMSKERRAQWEAKMEERKAQLEEMDAQIEEMDAQIKEMDAQLEELDAQIKENDAVIMELITAINQGDKEKVEEITKSYMSKVSSQENLF